MALALCNNIYIAATLFGQGAGKSGWGQGTEQRMGEGGVATIRATLRRARAAENNPLKEKVQQQKAGRQSGRKQAREGSEFEELCPMGTRGSRGKGVCGLPTWVLTLCSSAPKSADRKMPEHSRPLANVF